MSTYTDIALQTTSDVVRVIQFCVICTNSSREALRGVRKRIGRKLAQSLFDEREHFLELRAVAALEPLEHRHLGGGDGNSGCAHALNRSVLRFGTA